VNGKNINLMLADIARTQKTCCVYRNDCR